MPSKVAQGSLCKQAVARTIGIDMVSLLVVFTTNASTQGKGWCCLHFGGWVEQWVLLQWEGQLHLPRGRSCSPCCCFPSSGQGRDLHTSLPLLAVPALPVSHPFHVAKDAWPRKGLNPPPWNDKILCLLCGGKPSWVRCQEPKCELTLWHLYQAHTPRNMIRKSAEQGLTCWLRVNPRTWTHVSWSDSWHCLPKRFCEGNTAWEKIDGTVLPKATAQSTVCNL